jgi:hypothetical protein
MIGQTPVTSRFQPIPEDAVRSYNTALRLKIYARSRYRLQHPKHAFYLLPTASHIQGQMKMISATVHCRHDLTAPCPKHFVNNFTEYLIQKTIYMFISRIERIVHIHFEAALKPFGKAASRVYPNSSIPCNA